MNAEFNEWWNEDLLTEDNPFVENTAAYWAWEGWCAAVKAERNSWPLEMEAMERQVNILTDALAKLNGKEQEPVEYWTVADGWVSEQAEVPAFVWVEPDFWEHCKHVNCGTAYRLPAPGRQPLYTSPPAQRTWVGLTDEEYINITDSVYHKGQGLVAYYKAIEAKLKEKNNG